MPAFKDLTGQRFGRLTVLSRAANGLSNDTKWLCLCECSVTKNIGSQALIRGLTLSCGCLHKEQSSQQGTKDMAGQTFGRLTVLRRTAEKRGDSREVIWACRCSCGQNANVSGVNLRLKGTKSCGCLQREIIGDIRRTHGLSHTSEYSSWQSMMHRCYKPSHDSYPYYGGRGIAVCNAWHTFESFFEAMGPKPTTDHQIDRRDGTKGYSPENCRWATVKEQALNRTSTRLVTFNNKTMCAADWARELGLTPTGLSNRLDQWPIERALTPKLP